MGTYGWGLYRWSTYGWSTYRWSTYGWGPPLKPLGLSEAGPTGSVRPTAVSQLPTAVSRQPSAPSRPVTFLSRAPSRAPACAGTAAPAPSGPSPSAFTFAMIASRSGVSSGFTKPMRT